MHWLDPAYLPAVTGTITAFTRNVHGDVDGMLLDDDRQVHVPPHLGARVEKRFAVGDTLEARCVMPRGAAVYAAVSITSADGRAIVDDGPGPKHERPAPVRPATRPVEFAGTVRRTLFAPKGEVCGAVLESGEQVRVDPKANPQLADCFVAGTRLHLWGEAFKRKGTTVVELTAVAFANEAG